jgi:hypothetical protein
LSISGCRFSSRVNPAQGPGPRLAVALAEEEDALVVDLHLGVDALVGVEAEVAGLASVLETSSLDSLHVIQCARAA